MVARQSEMSSRAGSLAGSSRAAASARWLGVPPRQASAPLDFLQFPAAAAKKQDAGGGDRGFHDDDRDGNAVDLHPHRNGEEIGERYFEQEKAKEVDNSRRNGVARAVEGLQHHHAVGVADIAVAQDPQRGRGQRDYRWILREKPHDRRRKQEKEDADAAEEKHVVKASAPDGFFGAVRPLGAEILADQRRRGIAEAPGGQHNENKNPYGDRVPGECRRTEDADDADQANPTCVCDGELQDAGQRDTQQPQEYAKVQADLAPQNTNAFSPA